MAETVYLTLQIDGDDIPGDSPTTTMEREDTIVCHSVSWGVESAVDVADARRGGGKPIVMPLRIRKQIDRATPFLIKALLNSEPVTKAEFRFFRPAQSGSGAEEQYYTVQLKQARIIEVSQVSEDVVVTGAATLPPPPLEEVAFVYATATWTDQLTGAEAEYSQFQR